MYGGAGCRFFLLRLISVILYEAAFSLLHILSEFSLSGIFTFFLSSLFSLAFNGLILSDLNKPSIVQYSSETNALISASRSQISLNATD